MKFNVRNNRIEKTEYIELTPNQADLLKMLLTNDLVWYEEIYKNTNMKNYDELSVNLARLRQKTGLNIETRKTMGLVLKDAVFVDY